MSTIKRNTLGEALTAALADFERQMSCYGLDVDTQANIKLSEDTMVWYAQLTTFTVPLVGNEDKLERLEKDGYHVYRWMRSEAGKRYFAFSCRAWYTLDETGTEPEDESASDGKNEL